MTQRETACWMMQQGDLAELHVHAKANRALAAAADERPRIILLGDSITCHGRDPATIPAANEWLRGFAAVRGYGLLDYHGVLAGKDRLIRAAYTSDGLHLTASGYQQVKALLAAAGRSGLAR